MACYRAFDDVGGVIHSHPVYASMFALARQPVPASIEEFVVFVGGDVQVCEYAPTGSDKLGVEAVKNLADPSATLLANHGMASIGADPQSALRVAALVEKVAKIVIGARSLGPEHSLPDESQRGFADVYKILRPTSLP